MSQELAALSDRESALEHDDKLELKLWLRLLTCTSMIEGQVRSRLRERFSTTLPRFDLLAQLERAPEGLTMSELSSRLMVTGANVTGLVDTLEREGLVGREAHPTDRRSQVISLSEKGRRVFDEMAPAHEQWVDAMMGGLSRAAMAELFQLLGHLKASVQKAGRDS
jgi:DNA-binding MarR family transcriptional regulator